MGSNRKLGGRWVAPGESPFGDRNSKDNQARRRLMDPNKRRNEEWARYLNQRYLQNGGF